MRHDQARCGCGAIVQLPHAKARAYTARCGECHRRAAGAAPDAGVMRACEFGKLAEQNAPEPDSPFRTAPAPVNWASLDLERANTGISMRMTKQEFNAEFVRLMEAEVDEIAERIQSETWDALFRSPP